MAKRDAWGLNRRLGGKRAKQDPQGLGKRLGGKRAKQDAQGLGRRLGETNSILSFIDDWNVFLLWIVF